MNHPLPDMMSGTMGKIREMIGANAIVGDPIVLGESLTIIPISKVSFGFAGGAAISCPNPAMPPTPRSAAAAAQASTSPPSRSWYARTIMCA